MHLVVYCSKILLALLIRSCFISLLFSMFWYLLLVVGAVWLAGWRWQGRKLRNAAKQFPCDMPAWPVIGHSYQLIGTNEDRMTAFKKVGREAVKQGGITAISTMGQIYLVLADPQAADFILKRCLEKDQRTIRFLRMLTGVGLLFAPVNIWRSRRKVAAPTFSMKNLNRFVQVFARQSAVMIEQLQPVADGRDFSIWKYLTAFTFDSVCETNLGVQINAQKVDNHPFIDAMDTVFKELAKRYTQPWLYNDAVYRLLPQAKRFEAGVLFIHNYIDKIIRAKKLELAQKETSNVAPDTVPEAKKNVIKSFLDLLIEASGGSQGYGDVELREEVLVIILAGTDTSAVGASYAALMLSRYPEEQAKVYEEIQRVFGDSDRPLEADDLPKLKYLEVFLKETLRMYPPVPIISRTVQSDVMLPSGKSVVAGMGIVLNIWAMHRNQQYWGEDADQFRPERFLQPLRHPAQFIPFSYGMRNCIGYQYAMMSMKTVVASLVRRYRLLPPAGLSRKELRQELRVEFDIMMKHVDNYVLRLEPRH